MNNSYGLGGEVLRQLPTHIRIVIFLKSLRTFHQVLILSPSCHRKVCTPVHPLRSRDGRVSLKQIRELQSRAARLKATIDGNLELAVCQLPEGC